MSKGRRTPPLFDVLSGVEGRSRPGQVGTGAATRSGGMGTGLPIQVQVPASAPRSGAGVDVGEMRPLSGERSPVAKKIKVTAPVMWIGVACVLALLAAAWFFAFQMGKTNAEQEFVKRIDGTTSASGSPASGIGNGGATPNGGGQTPGGPSGLLPAPTPPPVPQPLVPPSQGTNTLVFSEETDPREVGVNYLHIVSLAPSDAEAAAEYLTKNGVRAGAVQVRKVDGRGGAANNPALLLVFMLDGVPSDRFKATAKERADLVEKIRTIGKQFQRDQRGASDFASPQWTKFESR